LSGNGLDDLLINAINRSKEKFNVTYREINRLYPNRASEFFSAILQSNKIGDLKYEEILLALNVAQFSLNLENLTNSKLSILIKDKMFKLDKSTLDLVRNRYTDNVSELIEHYIDSYIDLVKVEGVNLPELLMTLSNTKIFYTKRMDLLKRTSTAISISNRNYSISLEARILESNFNEADLPYILQECYIKKPQHKVQIEKLLSKYLVTIIARGIPLNYELLLYALQNTNFDSARKFELFANSVSSLSYSQSIRCLTILKEVNFLSIFFNKKPIFTNTAYNSKVLQYFENEKWIKKVTKRNDGTIMANGCYQMYRLE
jgi:hypothetical protein